MIWLPMTLLSPQLLENLLLVTKNLSAWDCTDTVQRNSMLSFMGFKGLSSILLWTSPNYAPKKLGPKCFIHSDDSFQVITCAFLTAARKAVAVSLTSFVSSVTSLDLLGIGDSISILTPSACRAKASVVRFFTHFVLISLLLSFSVGKFAAKTTRTPWKLMPQ